MIGHSVDGGGVSSVSMLGLFTQREREEWRKRREKVEWPNQKLSLFPDLLCTARQRNEYTKDPWDSFFFSIST